MHEKRQHGWEVVYVWVRSTDQLSSRKWVLGKSTPDTVYMELKAKSGGMTERKVLNGCLENKWKTPPCANLTAFPTLNTWNR